MPTPTFFNLTEEKKQRIIDAAVDEFSTYSFKNASIARIIKKASIPRGSFYQYFEDIKDLYYYVFQLAAEKKLQYMGPVVKKLDDTDIFKTIREVYIAGIQFAKENPKLGKMGNRFLKEDDDVKQEIIRRFQGTSDEFFGLFLKKGQEKGEIDPKVDIKIASLMFTTLHIAMVDKFLARGRSEELHDYSDDFLNAVDQMLFILENGMRGRNSCFKSIT